MTTRAVEQVGTWDSEPFGDGFRGLHDLADADFSGVVESDRAELCMLNGTVVGVLDGSIDDFEGATGTAYASPSPALPLLALMQDRNDEARAKYYTEDTPLSEVDETLSEGGFSGYVELSENVLSGDYYVVYHGGRSMAVAFVGNSGQLLSGEEAFERADGEVGIYEVRPAGVDAIEIPEPPEPDPDESADTDDAAATDEGAASPAADEPETADPDGRTREGAAGTSATDDGAVESDPEERPTATGEARETGPDADERASEASRSDRDAETTEPGTASETDGASEEGASGDRARADRSGGDESDRREGARSNRDARTEGGTAGADVGRSARSDRTRSDRQPERERREESARGSADAHAGRSAGSAPSGDRGASEPRADSAGSPDHLETHSIPSLDPSHSTSHGRDEVAGTDGAVPETIPNGANGRQRTGRDDATTAEREVAESAANGPDDGDTRGRRQSNPEGTRADAAESGAEVAEMEEELDRLEGELAALEAERDELAAERDELEADLASVREERDDLEAERDDLREEVDRLQSEVERLETRLERVEDEYGAATDADRRLSRDEALDQTNVFVRYGSKGQATLESAHDGEADREDVTANLELEFHTQFDADSVSVAGRRFEEFFEDTIQYRFVTWVVGDLLYEIRDTGKVANLEELYDAIPRIDRAELNGTIGTRYNEEGQERRSQETFDVVMRDRMGDPLLVANFNDSRQAATENMMSSLVTASSHVGESTGTLAASLLVTSSFFEPEALETAAEATSGGLLSRDKRASFVKLTRKQGYHLCLAEAREGKFHLAVPEL